MEEMDFGEVDRDREGRVEGDKGVSGTERMDVREICPVDGEREMRGT